MRNIFDQYDHPENRLTHALVSALVAEPILLRRFIRWVTLGEIPKTQLEVLEQARPGEEESGDEDEAERRGLPDAWIHDGNTWALLIESKIKSPLRWEQLERHRRTAEKRGFTDVHLLALVTELPKNFPARGIRIKQWTELYCWLLKEQTFKWARQLSAYMEVLERKLITDDYLREGTLTVFAGIPFGKDSPYNYHEAKRVLRMAMDELRKRSDLKRELGMDPNGKGRVAITGLGGTRVWDFLPLMQSRGAKSFTEFPHLTLGIHQEELLAIVTVPHGIRRAFRSNLLAGGREGFCALFENILDNFGRAFKRFAGVAPWVEVLQRRYPGQRSQPIMDARLQFDLRTGFQKSVGGGRSVKRQPQWLNAAYDALSRKNSNLQLGIGGVFPYDLCPAVHTSAILDAIAKVWLACRPLIRTMIE